MRELEHAVERLVALSDGPEIDADPFAAGAGAGDGAGAPGLRERIARFERGVIREALERCGGNQSETARRLGIGRVTLLEKLKRHGLR